MAPITERPGMKVYETGAEPEFFADQVRIEPASGGNVRVYAYVAKHDTLHLLFTVIVPVCALAKMGRQCLAAASEAHNMSQWEREFRGH